jgi:beta-lactam-binding protein with PASTA domain
MICTLLIIGYLVTKLEVEKPHFVIVVLALIIISPIVLGYLYSTYIAPVPEVKVPNVVMLDVSEARDRLAKFGLVARVAEKAYEKNVPVGSVISHKPEAGSVVKVGRIINLKVSIGDRMINVPNLVGRPFNQIEEALSEAGLKVGGKTFEPSEQFQSGVVTAQNPLPETEVPVGSRVSVTISENPNFGVVKVPNLVSKTLDDARRILQTLKLKAIVFYHQTKQFKPGFVLSQDPLEGQDISMGSSVKIFISVAPTGEGQYSKGE